MRMQGRRAKVEDGTLKLLKVLVPKTDAHCKSMVRAAKISVDQTRQGQL